MEKISFRIILNPKAGKGRALGRKEEICARMDQSGVKYEIVLTEGIGHATELAYASDPAQWSVLVSAGGDGTANEIVNGLMRRVEEGKKIPTLGVLAVGRGNDFACGVDIPDKLDKGLDILLANHRRPLDLGRVKGGDYPQGRYFCNGLGIGFDTIVGLEAAKMTHVHGFMAYVFGALKTFIRYPKAPQLCLRYNGKEICCQSHQINIMNGRRLGGIFWMAPQGKSYDGLLDLCMLRQKIGRATMANIMFRYTKGSQAVHPMVLMDKAARFSISAPQRGLVVHADGEKICVDGDALEVEIFPAALSLITDIGGL